MVLILVAVLLAILSAASTWLILDRVKPSEDAKARWGAIALVAALVLLLVYLLLPESW